MSFRGKIMQKQIIQTTNAPTAIGTYSQAIKVSSGQTMYLSGQIPLVPETMQIISDDISEQITQVFKNLEQVCVAANGDLTNIVKLNIYLTNLGNFALVNEIMAEFFSVPYPARAAIEISKLPKDALVEMDAVAVFE
jgi:reactive intermediate/imine deaminase